MALRFSRGGGRFSDDVEASEAGSVSSIGDRGTDNVPSDRQRSKEAVVRLKRRANACSPVAVIGRWCRRPRWPNYAVTKNILYQACGGISDQGWHAVHGHVHGVSQR